MEKIEKLEEIEDKISQNLVRCESENKELEKDDYMWDSMSVDAIENIDARENKMKKEIGLRKRQVGHTSSMFFSSCENYFCLC
jgi:hypothetical protein